MSDITNMDILHIIENESKGNEFVVDFDRAWAWIGYSKKGNAKAALLENFEENIDFELLLEVQEQAPSKGFSPLGGAGMNKETILLTIDCFKQFAMMARTAKGKEVRLHFIKVEKDLKEMQLMWEKDKAALDAARKENEVMRKLLVGRDEHRQAYNGMTAYCAIKGYRPDWVKEYINIYVYGTTSKAMISERDVLDGEKGEWTCERMQTLEEQRKVIAILRAIPSVANKTSYPDLVERAAKKAGVKPLK